MRPWPNRCVGAGTCHLHLCLSPAPRPRGASLPPGGRPPPGEPAGPGPRTACACFPGTHLHFHLEPLKPQLHMTDGGVSGTEPSDGVIVGHRGPFRGPGFKGQSCCVTRPLSLGCHLHGRQTCLPILLTHHHCQAPPSSPAHKPDWPPRPSPCPGEGLPSALEAVSHSHLSRNKRALPRT